MLPDISAKMFLCVDVKLQMGERISCPNHNPWWRKYVQHYSEFYISSGIWLIIFVNSGDESYIAVKIFRDLIFLFPVSFSGLKFGCIYSCCWLKLTKKVEDLVIWFSYGSCNFIWTDRFVWRTIVDNSLFVRMPRIWWCLLWILKPERILSHHKSYVGGCMYSAKNVVISLSSPSRKLTFCFDSKTLYQIPHVFPQLFRPR